MVYVKGWIFVFVCFLGLTLFRSYRGDDDVVYRFIDRKPTPQEGLVRIRWVLLKAFASFYGGLILTLVVVYIARLFYPIHLTRSQTPFLSLACIVLVSLAISLLQNEIRRLCGRQKRPIVDWSILRRNLRQWTGGDERN
jgi:hypothetical protein